MRLSKNKIKILKAIVDGPLRSREIAKSIGLSKSHTSSLLRSLIREGLVRRIGWGYSFGDSIHATLLRHILRKHPSMRFESVLCETELMILEGLYRGVNSVNDLASESGRTVRTVYYKLSVFQSMALVHELYHGRYGLSREHPLYDDLVSLFTAGDLSRKYFHPELEYGDSLVVWSRPPEFMVRTREPGEYIRYIEGLRYRWAYTSSSALDHYGVYLIPPYTFLYITGRETGTIKRLDEGYVSVEDLILHLLLMNHPESRRYIHWLIQKHEDRIDFRYLRRKALEYKLRKKIESILYDLKPILKRRRN